MSTKILFSPGLFQTTSQYLHNGLYFIHLNQFGNNIGSVCLMNFCFYFLFLVFCNNLFISCLLFLRFLFLRISCVKYIYAWSKSAYPLLFRRFLFSSKLSIPLYFIPTTSPLGREKMSWTKPLSSLT